MRRIRRRGPTRRSCGLIIVLAGLGIAACSSEPTDPAPAPDTEQGAATGIVERDGVLYVRNPAVGLWEAAATPALRFELDGAFGGRDAALGSIGGAVVGNDGNVYVYDALRHQLVGFAGGGAVRWRSGSQGTGADQFEAVRGIAYDGDRTLWVVNQDGMRLDAWSVEGEHVRGLDLGELEVGRSFMGGFLSGNRIALLADIVYATAANEYVVLQLGEHPNIAARFRIGAEPMTPIPPGVVLQLSHYFDGDRIYVGGWESYVLRVYDADGTLLRHVSVPVDYLRRPGFAAVGDRYRGISFGGLAAPIILQDGHWLVLASWPTNVDNSNAFAEIPPDERPAIEWASSLDLFDPEGRFLYSLRSPGTQLPEIGRPWAVGPQGHLFTVSAEPVPQVRRYRVVLDPPS